MSDITERLRDLHKQATVERSHYYVGSVVASAIDEIERLRAELMALIFTADRGQFDDHAMQVLWKQCERARKALALPPTMGTEP